MPGSKSLYQSYGFNYGDSQESFVKEQLKFLRVVEQMISSFENLVWIPIFRDSTCYFTGVGDPEECAKADGISYYNSGTGELRKPLQYRNGISFCHDTLFCCGSIRQYVLCRKV